jgi:D-alanine transaminase
MNQRICYVNGRFLYGSNAQIGIEDRGYQFADGIYEVIEVINGTLIDGSAHLDRLDRSLAGLKINQPYHRAIWEHKIHYLLGKQRQKNGALYIQVTRGEAKRQHMFPAQPVQPAVVMNFTPLTQQRLLHQRNGVKAIIVDEIRWRDCWIKSISLLPNCLAKQQAVELGAYEAIWVRTDNQVVTEGASSNIFAVHNGALYTHPANGAILPGIVRARVLKQANQLAIPIREQPFNRDFLLNADGVFLTSTTSHVMPITMIHEKKMGDGTPCAITHQLITRYENWMAEIAF